MNKQQHRTLTEVSARIYETVKYSIVDGLNDGFHVKQGGAIHLSLTALVKEYEKALQEEPEKEPGLSDLSFADLWAMHEYFMKKNNTPEIIYKYQFVHMDVTTEIDNRIEQLKGGKS